MSRRTRIAAGTAAGAAGLLLGWAWFVGRKTDDTAIAYAPVNVPKLIAEGLWIVDGPPICAGGARLPIRMTVARLTDGSLWLHSPIQFSASLGEVLAALGPVRHLVAPTFAHWTFLKDWQAAYPDARTWSAPHLRERKQVLRSGINLDVDLEETAPPDWADLLGQGVVSGARGFSEAWFFHRPSRTLILTDLIENLDPEKLTPLSAFAFRALGGTRASVPFHIRAVLVPRAATVRKQFAEMRALEPERVVFAHGAWFEGGGAARLARAFAWLTPAT